MSNAFKQLNLSDLNCGTWIGNTRLDSHATIASYSPVDGKCIGTVTTTTKSQYEEVVVQATEAWMEWRKLRATKRGEIVRQ